MKIATLARAVARGRRASPLGRCALSTSPSSSSSRALSTAPSSSAKEPEHKVLPAMPEKEYEALKANLIEFMHSHIYPNEVAYHHQCKAQSGSNEWVHPPLLVELMKVAKSRGLWNLFLPVHSAAVAGVTGGGGLTNLQYADLCEIMGTSVGAEFAAQATNCTSPDTGNMETIARFGTAEQKAKWLVPLLTGEIRSCFAMTEPDVASSDATNISIDIQRDGDEYVINGRKWWTTGAASLHTKIMILMGKVRTG